LFWGLLLAWGLANMVQAWGLTLDPDEAYYWMYSKHLAWGYFDHPPAIALLIRLTASWLGGELGVRLGVVLLQMASFVLLWDLLGRPKARNRILLLFALLVAQPFLHVYGFIATSDSPLLFSTVLFLWAYRRYTDLPALSIALLLGLSMALLLYSKYHGLLVIAFVVLSNPRLFRQPLFYIASFLGLLLFLPHLYWQWMHDFPSFRYHLVERNNQFEWKYPLTYLVNQLVLFNPLMIGFLVYALWKERRSSLLNRACFMLVAGFWLFFLLSTLRGHAEPQWTAVVALGLIPPAFSYSLNHPLFAKWVGRLGLISLLLFIAIRILLVFPPESFPSPFKPVEWTRELAQTAGERNVFFQNSYQDASLFSFYTGRPAYTYTDIYYRKNQFDIWQLERRAHGQPALIAGNKSLDCSTCQNHKLGRRRHVLYEVDTLEVAQHLQMTFDTSQLRWLAGTELSMPISLHNPYPFDLRLANEEMPIRPAACFVRNEHQRFTLEAKPVLLPTVLSAGETVRTWVKFSLPEAKTGDYAFAMGLQWGVFQPGIHSDPVPIVIRPTRKQK